MASGDLPIQLQPVAASIREFLKSDSQILQVAGMIGTGTSRLHAVISELATAQGMNCLILAPNRRMANHYPVKEAESLYFHVYKTRPRLEKSQLVYEVAENRDSDTQVYVVGDCHLVSDSQFETDVFRYGSGQLLSDFLSFVELEDSNRKIILIGDLYQMARGKAAESALSPERIEALTGLSAIKLVLEERIVGERREVFTVNCVEFAKSIDRGLFNHIHVHSDDDACVRLPENADQRGIKAKELLQGSPGESKFIAFSHAEVNRLNEWIRNSVHSRSGPVVAGDIVHIHNGFFLSPESDLDRPIYIPNDSFAEVIAVDDSVEPLKQPLRGRDAPIEVPFLSITARLLESGQHCRFLCLRDYLYAEKPELEADTVVALHVNAQARFKAHLIQLEGDGENVEERRAQFMRDDPYLNAARIRFGYALTLHRAQGRQFDTVLASLDTGQGQENEAYMRWLYTLFTIPSRELYLSNIPEVSPLSHALWDESKCRLDSVKPANIVPYTIDNPSDSSWEPSHLTEGKELRSLYRYIEFTMHGQGWSIANVEHRQYQEIYDIEGDDGALCRLLMYYNKHCRVSTIEVVNSKPGEFAQSVQEELTRGVQLESELQVQFYKLLSEKLCNRGIRVVSIDHHPYQEVYYVEGKSGSAKLQMYYTGEGFITRVSPGAHSSDAILEEVRASIGI